MDDEKGKLLYSKKPDSLLKLFDFYVLCILILGLIFANVAIVANEGWDTEIIYNAVLLEILFLVFIIGFLYDIDDYLSTYEIYEKGITKPNGKIFKRKAQIFIPFERIEKYVFGVYKNESLGYIQIVSDNKMIHYAQCYYGANNHLIILKKYLELNNVKYTGSLKHHTGDGPYY